MPSRTTPSCLGLSPLAGALRPLLPEWAGELPPALETLENPKETRHRLLRAMTELVERLGVATLVVEDAHWSDAATMEWLLTLCASGDPRMSIVVTFRPHDVPAGSLLRRLTSRRPVGMTLTRIELQPLDVSQTGELVRSILGADKVSEQVAELLHQRTDGIPLALEETIRSMRERRDIVHQDGEWTRRWAGLADRATEVAESTASLHEARIEASGVLARSQANRPPAASPTSRVRTPRPLRTARRRGPRTAGRHGGPGGDHRAEGPVAVGE